MNDIRDAGIQVECVKVAMRQSKDGFILSLSLHPDDSPEQLLRDRVGQRYMAVLVPLDDEEQPIVPQTKTDGDKALAIAGALAGDPRFQGWMVINDMADNANEESAAAGIRKYCGITSRKELKVNADARAKLRNLIAMFENDLRSS